jgi:putative membrane protein
MLEALRMSVSFQSLLSFVLYIVVAGGLFSLFQMAYTRLTPHKEFAQIREGNVAAAVALGGALIGFALPASNVITYSISVLDVVIWAVIAAVVQLLAFTATSMVLKDLSARITRGELAPAIYAASVSISVGFLNSACMTPST